MATENLKKAAGLLISFIKQGETSFKDGFQLSDLFAFMGQFAQVPEVIQNKQALIDEWKNKTNADVQDLLTFIDTNLAIQNAEVEAKIKAAIAALIANVTLIELFVKKSNPTPPVTPVTPPAS